MNNPTVAELRRAGFKVRVTQMRYNKNDTKFSTLVPTRELSGAERGHKGGELSVEITSPQGDELVGRAICSKKDSFNRKIALKMSIGRALAKKTV